MVRSQDLNPRPDNHQSNSATLNKLDMHIVRVVLQAAVAGVDCCVNSTDTHLCFWYRRKHYSMFEVCLHHLYGFVTFNLQCTVVHFCFRETFFFAVETRISTEISTLVLKLSFSQSLSLHIHLSLPQANLLELWPLVVWQSLAVVVLVSVTD